MLKLNFLMLAAALMVLLTFSCQAQQSTVYMSVLTNKAFISGAANPRTGFFWQHPDEDTLWHQIGPINTRNFQVAVGPRSSGRTLYMATGPGVLKSSDRGATWLYTTDWKITEVLWVTPDPNDSGTVYAATAYGIFKTTDGCKTWKEMNHGLGSTFTQCVIADHNSPNTLYCAADDGVYKTEDGAATWKKLGLNVGGVHLIAQHPRERKKLAVATEDHGIYMSDDGGMTWNKSESGIEHSTFFTVVYDPVNPETMYAGGYMTGVYKSVDGGKSWKWLCKGLEYPKVHSIAVDPTNNNRVYAGTLWGGVFRSDDGGASWRNVGHMGSQVYFLTILPF
jgi:photosystem II stability/assembly factor-like uncharacterized protein